MSHSVYYRRILHRLGYYDYQQALVYRHLNQEGGWNTHLQNCRKFILKAIERQKPEIITVLGSGWLLDLPLVEMAGMAQKINLVDIVHPPEVKSQVAVLGNTVLYEEDVTGGLVEEIWRKARRRSFFKKKISGHEIVIPVYRPQYDPGLVISLNILTQLESLPINFLKRHTLMSDGQLLNFRKEIQKKHLDFLLSHDSVLITDTTEVETGNSGDRNTLSSLLIDLPEGTINEEWNWYFDLRKSDYFRKKSLFKVTAKYFTTKNGKHQEQVH